MIFLLQHWRWVSQFSPLCAQCAACRGWMAASSVRRAIPFWWATPTRNPPDLAPRCMFPSTIVRSSLRRTLGQISANLLSSQGASFGVRRSEDRPLLRGLVTSSPLLAYRRPPKRVIELKGTACDLKKQSDPPLPEDTCLGGYSSDPREIGRRPPLALTRPHTQATWPSVNALASSAPGRWPRPSPAG